MGKDGPVAARDIFATYEEAQRFLHAWIALEILFAAWTFAITWHPGDSRSFVIFIALAVCFIPFQIQLGRLGTRRGRPFGFMSPSLQWELMLHGPYEALRFEGASRPAALAIEALLIVLPLATAAVGAVV